MTDQWDEDRQDWTTPDRPEGPPPGERSTRVAVVTALAVLLCAAVGAGIWALARDSGGGGSDAGPPGLSVPSASYGAETAAVGGGGDVPSDACAAVSYGMAEEWGLQRDTTMTDEGACRWLLRDGDTFLITLAYTDEPPRQYDGTTPIPVDGISSAGSYSLSGTCLVEWPTSFGTAFVLASEVSHTDDRDLCDLAADFAGAVAPAVPD